MTQSIRHWNELTHTWLSQFPLTQQRITFTMDTLALKHNTEPNVLLSYHIYQVTTKSIHAPVCVLQFKIWHCNCYTSKILKSFNTIILAICEVELEARNRWLNEPWSVLRGAWYGALCLKTPVATKRSAISTHQRDIVMKYHHQRRSWCHEAKSFMLYWTISHTKRQACQNVPLHLKISKYTESNCFIYFHLPNK